MAQKTTPSERKTRKELIREISELKARALRERPDRESRAKIREKLRLRTALRIAQLGVWEYDSRADLTRLDEHCRSLFGFGEDRPFASSEIFDRIHPQDRQRVKSEMRVALMQGESGSYETEYRIVLPDGTCRWLRVLGNGAAWKEEDGTHTDFIGTLMDVTESRQAEAELTRQRELLEQIFLNIPILLILWDPRFSRFYLNRHAEETLGWNNADATEGDFMTKVFPDPAYRSKVTENMLSLAPGWHEWLTTTKDGRRLPIDWANIYLSDETMIGIGIDLQERKNVELALRNNSDRLLMALEATQLGTWQYDPEAHQFTLDERSRTIIGQSEETLHALDFIALVHPEDRERVNETVRKGLSPEKGEGVVDFRLTRPDGSERWINATGRTYFHFNKKGRKAVHAIGTLLDISERKKTEKAWKESAERLRLAAEVAEMYGWQFDLATRVFTPSENAARVMNFSVPKRIKDVWRRIHPDDYPRVRREMDRAVEECGEFKVEYRVRPTAETEYWVFSAGTVLTGPEGVPAQVVGVTQNITANKRIERALRDSEKQNREILESINDAFYALDSQWRIIYVNQRAQKLWGRDAGEMAGRILCDFFPGYRQTEGYRAHLKAMKERVPINFETFSPYIRLWVSVSIYPTAAGGLSVFFQDITDRKESELALKQLNETLEQRVAERTELADARSRQLQRLTVELIEAEERERRRVSELLHDDLQQLLASAKFHLEGARLSASPAPSLSRAEGLLKESIDKSRRLSHELSPPVLHHADFLEALSWLSRHMATQFGLEIELDAETGFRIPNTPLKMFLFRAVQEFLFNVVKHAGVKSAKITLSSSVKGAVISVTDRGKGFSPENLEQTRSEAGLGLRSIRERANYMGIRLFIESAPEKGSAFTLVIPQKFIQAPLQQSPHTSGKGNSAAGIRHAAAGDGEGIRLIFVDDHQVMREALVNMVRHQPEIEVVAEACNGLEALEMVRQTHPHAVVMDVSMPVMDGIEATRRIKTEFPDVLVLGLSMHTDREVEESMRRAGAEAFLSKSISTDELLAAIYRAFRAG